MITNNVMHSIAIQRYNAKNGHGIYLFFSLPMPTETHIIVYMANLLRSLLYDDQQFMTKVLILYNKSMFAISHSCKPLAKIFHSIFIFAKTDRPLCCAIADTDPISRW